MKLRNFISIGLLIASFMGLVSCGSNSATVKESNESVDFLTVTVTFPLSFDSKDYVCIGRPSADNYSYLKKYLSYGLENFKEEKLIDNQPVGAVTAPSAEETFKSLYPSVEYITWDYMEKNKTENQRYGCLYHMTISDSDDIYVFCINEVGKFGNSFYTVK